MQLFQDLALNNGKWVILPIWLWYLDEVHVFSQSSLTQMGKLNTQSPIYCMKLTQRIDLILDTHSAECKIDQ